MAGPTWLPLILTAALLLGLGAEAAADGIDIGKDCRDTGSTLLGEHHWYSYDVDVLVTTGAADLSNEFTELALKCSIKVQHSSDCAYTLEFDTCTHKAASGDPSGTTPWLEGTSSIHLSEHPIAFTVSGGEAKSVLAHPNDPLHVVNLKKGIISALLIGNQVSPGNRKTVKKAHHDVQGQCPLTLVGMYSAAAEDMVVATKDLYKCNRSEDLGKPIKQGSPFSLVWDMSLLKYYINSTFECVSTLEQNGKRLHDMRCTEKHSMNLASTYQTKISYSFALQDSGEAKSISPLQVDGLKQTPIDYIYEDHELDEDQNEDPAEAKQMLQQLVDESEVSLETIPKYLALVQRMRHLGDLQELTEEAEKCPDDEKDCARKHKAVPFYLDALVQCNRLPCVKEIRKLHSQKLVKKSLLELALLSWLRMPVKDHRYFPEILEMCKESQSRFCWLSLGGLVKRYSHHHDEFPSEIRDVVNTFSSILGASCDPKEVTFPSGTPGDQKINYIITMLRAVGNIGKSVKKIEPGMLQKLLACVRNSALPTGVRHIAFMSMNKHGGPYPPEVMNEMISNLEDKDVPFRIRTESYLTLVEGIDLKQTHPELAQKIADVLKDDPSMQLKTYIASNLLGMAEDESNEFAKELIKQSKDRGVDLDELTRKDGSKFSYFDSHKGTTSLLEGILPEELSSFGYSTTNEAVFNGWSAFPVFSTAALGLKLFGQDINIGEVGLQVEGLDGLLVRATSTLKDLMDSENTNAMQYVSFILQQLSIRKPPMKRPKAAPPALLNQNWEDNIRLIHNTFQNSHLQDISPHVLLYLRVLGVDLDFTTLSDIAGNVQRLMQQMSQSSRPQPKGSSPQIPFSRAHVINFLEGEHLFPTSIGALLKWRGNFTLAVSLDAKLDVNVKQQSGSLHFKPRLAFTMTNQMVFSLPGITDIGLQSDNSIYSATQWDIDGSGGPTMKISFATPAYKHRILELYRNNHAIHGSQLQELKDPTGQRADSNKCLGDKFVKATGMKLCVRGSHLEVKGEGGEYRFFWPARAYWAISSEMEDEGIKAYTMTVAFKRKGRDEYQLDVNADAKGGALRREVPLKVSLNKGTGQFSLDLKHSDFQDFSLTATKDRIVEKDESVGYIADILLKDTGLNWNFHHKKTNKKEVREGRPKNESPHGQSIETRLVERETSIKTLYNDYNFKLKLHTQPSGNLKVDSLLSYQNLDQDHNWLNRILPDIFYEEGHRKAWLEFRGDWRFGRPKSSSHKAHHGDHHGGHRGGHQRESKSHLTIPATVIEVKTHHMDNPKHSMLCFNVSKVERRSGNLLLFANMTYNVWRKGHDGHRGDEIRSANLTLARHSWTLESRTQGNLYAGDNSESSRIYTLKGEKMVPKDPEADGHYIGWWNPKSASRFDSSKWKVIYRQNLRRKLSGVDNLPAETLKEVQDDISSEENDGHSSEEEDLYISSKRIKNEAIHADVSLEYPYGDKQENLTFNGNFQWNGQRAPAYRIFLKTFTLASTRLGLQLESESLWTKAGNEKLILSHHSSITNTETKSNQGVYNLLFKKQLQGTCTNVHLNHSITAHWLNFASHVIGSCKNGDPKARQYDIHIQSDHTYWKELNYELNQKIDLSRPGGETMDFTSPTMDIKVKGAWDADQYSKQADFTSKTDLMPSTRWEFASDRKKLMSLQILAPDEELSKISLSREVLSGGRQVEYNVSHVLEPNEAHQDFHMRLKAVNSRTMNVAGSLSTDLGMHMGMWTANFVTRATERIMSKLGDPNHELNENLKDVLGGRTILQYLVDLEKKVCKEADKLARELYEIVQTFESFYGPSFKIVTNSIHELETTKHKLTDALANTHLGRAWNYYDLRKLLKGSTPKVRVGKDGEIIFDHNIQHPFIVQRFNEKITLDESQSLWDKLENLRDDHHFVIPERYPFEKVAVLFGPSHFVTFDGRVMSFPDYPSEKCAVLLAHDVRGKTFSAVCDAGNLYLIFPDLAVTVHGTGRLYLNGSHDESPTPVTSYKKNVRVSRVGNIVRVESPFLDVDCDITNELCVFVLSPLMTGGIVGLLGNADGEQFNDLMGPDGKVLNSLAQLAPIYEVSKDESCGKFVEKPGPSTEDAKANKICEDVVRKVEVDKCLKSAGIDQEGLKVACLSDMQRENCPCATSKAITALCAYDGHELDRCKWKRRPEGSTPVPNQHDSWLIKGTHQLQHVFVVEANKGVLGGGSSQALKGLETLLENIENSFSSNGGYSSITYALVVYGAPKNNAPNIYMHTQHSNAFMLQRDLLKSVREIKFDSSSRGDPVAAVEFATTMIPFDPASTKIITLITLDDKPEASKLGYSHVRDVQKYLENHGAAIYVIASYPWLEHGKKVFGLRADGLIFPSGDDESYGNFPRMPAAKMAAGTRGSIFWRSFLEENKNPFYFESLAGEMLARVHKEAGKCRQCVCDMNKWWQRHTYCRPASPHLQKC